MGALLLIAMIVCWGLVLFQLVSRHSASSATRSVSRFNSAMRVLSGRGPAATGKRRWVSARERRSRAAAPTVFVSARRVIASPAAGAARLRRRVLGVLGAAVLGTAGAVVVRPVLLLLAAQAAADLALVSGLVALRMSTRREQRRRAERRRLAAEAMRRAAAARIRPAVAHIDLVAYERAQEAATSWAKPRAVVLPDTALPDAAIREVVLPGARAAYDDEPVAVNY